MSRHRILKQSYRGQLKRFAADGGLPCLQVMANERLEIPSAGWTARQSGCKARIVALQSTEHAL